MNCIHDTFKAFSYLFEDSDSSHTGLERHEGKQIMT